MNTIATIIAAILCVSLLVSVIANIKMNPSKKSKQGFCRHYLALGIAEIALGILYFCLGESLCGAIWLINAVFPLTFSWTLRKESKQS